MGLGVRFYRKIVTHKTQTIHTYTSKQTETHEADFSVRKNERIKKNKKERTKKANTKKEKMCILTRKLAEEERKMQKEIIM